jgi:hypothetical protein
MIFIFGLMQIWQPIVNERYSYAKNYLRKIKVYNYLVDNNI